MTSIPKQSKTVEFATEPASRPKPKVLKAALIGLLVLVLLIAAGVAYLWFSGGSGQASGATTAPALVLEPGDTRSLFQLAPGATEARFIITETLLGSAKTVVGATHDVAGEMLVDLNNPANSTLGIIRINLRTLETDNEIRNRAIRSQIFQADRSEFEYAEFALSELVGLPDNLAVGEAITFKIVGNLTVHGVSQPVTFDATMTLVSESQFEGIASTVVRYRDFGISIPEAPGVANISDEVQIEIEFVTQAVIR